MAAEEAAEASLARLSPSEGRQPEREGGEENPEGGGEENPEGGGEENPEGGGEESAALNGVVVSEEVKSNDLDVKVTESQLETEEKGTEEESTRESDSSILDVSSDYPREKHISIQRHLADLEKLADLKEDEKKPCPLCPEEKYKACYSHKLHRHLQNLHWKVSVEFEGYRMCICHLPCRPVKPNFIGDQTFSKMGAHYHCIVCSATITRRTDMISHINRHVNKGETESRFIIVPAPMSSHEVLKESATEVRVLPNYSTPQKSDSYFNPKMKLNRQLIFCALAVLAEERKPIECLDAFGATGIMGLQWAKHLRSSVKVTINDCNENSVTMIQENCHLNKMKVKLNAREEDNYEAMGDGEENTDTIEVTKMDANVIMHLRSFDFIHLDPFGTSVNYLDSAFCNVRNFGIVSLTSTDISSLYAKAQHVALRHYGCNIVRTEYYKELAARIVIAAVTRAAARCNKGIDVLLSVALEHFVLVVVRVLRGPSPADDSAKKIRYLIHCQWCEERIFQKEGHMVEENPYQQLPCDCHGSMPGKTAVVLGPLWSGALFNTGFLRRMFFEAAHYGLDEAQSLLKTLVCEAECTTLKPYSIYSSYDENKQEECGVYIKTPNTSAESLLIHGKRKSEEVVQNAGKRQKSENSAEHPAFYYNIHRHSIKGMNMPKLNKFLSYLCEAGYRVSRTHFDPMGVRTNAPLAQFKTILMKYSAPTYTGGQAEGPLHLAEGVQAGEQVEAAADSKVEDDAESVEYDKSEVAATTLAKACPTYCAAN
ncbi:tRNA (guanine(27)-N(2))-dimethyltransferase isoform X2 [Athene noctua]|uniref:tRNA (guanine(27)-N(2))-dimethyltransferase isoform X2 n=1 Tax=Athene noctua TaxID=126797 RepID=UPI003EBF3BE3